MKQLGIILFILITLFTLRHFQVIECSAAKFEYASIHSTLYKPDWYGSPYIVKEVNSFNRWYEDASIKLLPNEEKALQKVVDDLKNYQYLIDLGNEKKLYAKGDSVEICLNHISFDIEKMESSFFTSEYEVKIDSELDYYIAVDDNSFAETNYQFKMNTHVNTSGLMTPEFLEYNIKKLFLYELNRVAIDYFSGLSYSIKTMTTVRTSDETSDESHETMETTATTTINL